MQLAILCIHLRVYSGLRIHIIGLYYLRTVGNTWTAQKIVEKLRLCSEANKIIIVLANDSLNEHAFVNEVVHVISNEHMKVSMVIPVLYRSL